LAAGLRPDPLGELGRSPNPQAAIRWPTSKGREKEGLVREERKKKGLQRRGGEERGREGRGKGGKRREGKEDP